MTKQIGYVSTRGQSPSHNFETVLLSGLARDGGLYVPDKWPHFSRNAINNMSGLSYEDIVFKTVRPFIGNDLVDDDLIEIIEQSYAGFSHPQRCPLINLEDDLHLLELHHGPTLAFKDFALSLVARLFDRALRRMGRHSTLIGATSGDTGSAAIEAFRGLSSVNLFILYPDGCVSDIQRLQMTTPIEENVHTLAINGDFDDCQSLVKSMFNDLQFRDELGLAAVNSINWARIVAQIPYYFYAAVLIGAPERNVSFVVPTGNFGDVYAGYAARQMGLPIKRLVIATNQNDILFRVFKSGEYKPASVLKSYSPSMDIQVSSNFERALFDAYDRNGAKIEQKLHDLEQGWFAIDQKALNYLNSEFNVDRCSEEQTLQEIAYHWQHSGIMVCPHTAVGLNAARKIENSQSDPVVALATAHAAKFPEAIRKACGTNPTVPVSLKKILNRPERITTMPNDLSAIQSFIRENSHT